MDTIVQAISEAKVMVLVFSENANNSDDIKRELVLAGNAKVNVIPVRVEEVLPRGAFAYQFATGQWIDLFENWEHQLERLTTWISRIVAARLPSLEASNPKVRVEPETRAQREFLSRLQANLIALFYFNGHGVKAMGQNFLLQQMR
jgi:hypothetical protein